MGLLAAPFLLQSLQSDRETVRPVSIEALSQLESYLPNASPVNPGMEVIKARLVPPLMELMKHSDPQVRRAAYRAFAKFSLGAEGKTAAPLLRTAPARPRSGHSPIRVRGPAAGGRIQSKSEKVEE